MIRLEVFGPAEEMDRVERLLDRSEGVSRVRALAATRGGHYVVSASVGRHSVDRVVAELRRLGVPDDEITLTRAEELGRFMGARADDTLIWEDVLGSARLNARPVYHYLAFMLVAGVIAGYGVIDRNGILIVGAMAVSPDLLPITAIAVGVSSRNTKLAARALLTLALGMAAATGAAAVSALAQDAFNLIPGGFDIDATVLRSLTSVNDETIVVAFAAGIAGMLALETRASSAVGVAISVTTIPAAAYLGVVIGLGDTGKAGGALAVLGTNVAMMVLGASAALVGQRALGRRAGRTGG